jgi:hypothetical protein
MIGSGKPREISIPYVHPSGYSLSSKTVINPIARPLIISKPIPTLSTARQAVIESIISDVPEIGTAPIKFFEPYPIHLELFTYVINTIIRTIYHAPIDEPERTNHLLRTPVLKKHLETLCRFSDSPEDLELHRMIRPIHITPGIQSQVVPTTFTQSVATSSSTVNPKNVDDFHFKEFFEANQTVRPKNKNVNEDSAFYRVYSEWFTSVYPEVTLRSTRTVWKYYLQWYQRK